MAEDDLWTLATDLGNAPRAAIPRIRSAVQYTAHEIKDDWSQGAERSGLGNYSRSIDYDITDGAHGVEAEIGPNLRKRQGPFGFVEDGGGKIRSAPQHAGRDALEANQDDFERGLAIAIWDAVLGRKSRMGKP